MYKTFRLETIWKHEVKPELRVCVVHALLALSSPGGLRLIAAGSHLRKLQHVSRSKLSLELDVLDQTSRRPNLTVGVSCFRRSLRRTAVKPLCPIALLPSGPPGSKSNQFITQNTIFVMYFVIVRKQQCRNHEPGFAENTSSWFRHHYFV